ncbi:hypothetical protein PRIPAC_97285 [Pristionchus pacificus]|uniref:G protein-coupled receptor n=1 Tax=Pristionchus pacificus TaxID=54126 RepID=A0A2A6B3A4_PRIPA|nr:hypothetical protein PRIPAC_97285 [Pristionchus pacificus]|eukprot:PDM60352.1 G protein-coupled receptor [Pristionchus pacificus]
MGYYLEERHAFDELLIRFNLSGYSVASWGEKSQFKDFLMRTRVMCLNMIICLISPIVMTSIFIIRRMLVNKIAKSKATDKRQHEFIARALTYQMLLPCGAGVGVVIWLLDLAQIWSSEFTERFIMVMFSVFSLASPLINLTVLTPYRALLPCSRSREKKSTIGPNAPFDFTTAPVNIHLGIIWAIDLSAIAANLFLMLAIVFKTPKKLRSYSVFLINNALIDLTTAIASALGSVRIVNDPFEFSCLIVFLGPCTLVSDNLCRLSTTLQTNLVQHSTIILLLSFAYRLYILNDIIPSSPPPSRARLWLLCASSFLLTLPLTVLADSRQIGYYLEEKEVSEELLIQLNLKGYSVANLQIMQAMYVNAIISLISPIVLTAIFIIRRKLISRIAKLVSHGTINSDMSEIVIIYSVKKPKTTDKRQHELIARNMDWKIYNNTLKALTYQMLLPCAGAIGVVLWLLDISKIWSSEFSERMIMVIEIRHFIHSEWEDGNNNNNNNNKTSLQTLSVFSLTSPLINFIVLPPYRMMLPIFPPKTKPLILKAPFVLIDASLQLLDDALLRSDLLPLQDYT